MRMVISTAYGEGDPGRVAFAAPKRIGCAAVRNRSKRVLREAAREVGMPPAGCDAILFATPSTARAAHAELVQALESLCRRARR